MKTFLFTGVRARKALSPKAHTRAPRNWISKEVGSSYAYDDVWGDTPDDVRDMQRLGKKQEFKVLCTSAICRLKVAKTAVAQFQLHIYDGFCVYIHGYLGIRPRVRPPSDPAKPRHSLGQ